MPLSQDVFTYVETRLDFTQSKSCRQYMRAGIGVSLQFPDIFVKPLCAQAQWECCVFSSDRRLLTLWQLSFQFIPAEVSLYTEVSSYSCAFNSAKCIVVGLIEMCFILFSYMACFATLRNITDDESSVDELRGTLRFFASVLVRRIHKVR